MHVDQSGSFWTARGSATPRQACMYDPATEQLIDQNCNYEIFSGLLAVEDSLVSFVL